MLKQSQLDTPTTPSEIEPLGRAAQIRRQVFLGARELCGREPCGSPVGALQTPQLGQTCPPEPTSDVMGVYSVSSRTGLVFRPRSI